MISSARSSTDCGIDLLQKFEALPCEVRELAVAQPVDGCEVRASLEYDSDAINVGLLRLASERRKNEAESEHDRKPNPPHRHLVEDGWRGV